MKEETHIVKRQNQSSFEFGTTKNKHKVYYDDAEDLKKKLEELKTLFDGEDFINSFVEEVSTKK